MISKNSIIILSVLVCMSLGQLCTTPQKEFYMSYNAIGNHDHLATLFQNISLALPEYNTSYTQKDGSIYSIVDFRPHLFYNQHRQVENYHGMNLYKTDQLSVNVVLGQLYMSYRFDINIRHPDKNVTGWARGRALVDDYSFLKKLGMIDGGLEWDPYNLADLNINAQFGIQYSEPKLTLPETTMYISLLNDYLGGGMIKKQLIKKTNELFSVRLKYHLNHQPLVKNTSIEYKYGNITLNYTNIVKDYKLNNQKTKGLEAFLIFGFEDGQQQCIDLPTDFNQEDYGGVQEIISMGSVKATIQRAATMGLFDQVLDRRYEVPQFQFFMGDLGNFVDYANKLPAHDPFTISCVFSSERAKQLKITRFDEHDLYVQVPEDCVVSYKSATVMKMSFDMNLVVRLTAQEDSINAMITRVGIYGDKYFPTDAKFVVTDKQVATYVLTQVANGLTGKPVFGTGWKTFSRKYPVLRILEDYVVIYDASQK